MSNQRIKDIILLVAGVVLLIVSLTADMIGIGGHAGFGMFQIGGIVAGVIIAVVGLVWVLRK